MVGYVRRLKLQLQLLLLLALSASALTVQSAGIAVDNFVLLDQYGEAQELYYDKDVRAIVLIVQGNGCQIIRSLAPDISAIQSDYEARGVRLMMINSNLQDTRATIAAEAKEWEIEMPVLDDTAQIIGRSLALTRTGEVLVIDPKSRELVYRGALNDRVDYERQKKNANATYVRDVLDDMLDDKSVAYSEVNGPGCLINFSNADANQISYVQDIAPILTQNCVGCHSEGGIAPWAMTSYEMVKGFAPMIREVLRTKRMPPWHADPAIGTFTGNHGLPDDELASLVNWIEAGAQRGEGKDPLAALVPPTEVWTMGEPDLLLELPGFDVPASGEVDYQYPLVKNPLDHGIWVIAGTIVPGDAKAVHHVLVGSMDEKPTDSNEGGVFDNYIMGYAPGNESGLMPEGTGVYVPAGGYFSFQLHYTPYGRATVDKTRAGFYLADEPPANFLRQHVVLNPDIEIKPREANHEETAYFEFWDDATIFWLVPHAHYRGKSATFELQYPDGRSEVILSVPNYDFNWQRTYEFETPISVPAGTRIVHRMIYDNSTNNSGNPDPDREVPWGLQSWDEMLYGSVSFSWDNERSDAPLHDNVTADVAQWMGFMDEDADGLVQRGELPLRLRFGLLFSFGDLDGDDDGGLNLNEMVDMLAHLRGESG
ncbi:MAG: mono/diheme cytochrome c family protein [Halioglobus sp.]|jgi:mono/diheme cytochrome c family protein